MHEGEDCRPRRIAEYFVIAGHTPDLKPYDLSQIYRQGEEIVNSQNSSVDFTKYPEPIVDIQIINVKKGERPPQGYTVIDRSYTRQFKADLNAFTNYDEMYICFRRGRDQPPITDIGVYNPSDGKKLRENVRMIEKTVTGFCANVNNSEKTRLFITYMRANKNASVENLAVTDICIILENKRESCPPAYKKMEICLNQGMVGHQVFICYKKSVVKQHVLFFQPEVRFVYPDPSAYPQLQEDSVAIQDVANFCMPWGATFEAWEVHRDMPKPSHVNFVLTNEKYQRLYGCALTFYEAHTGSIDQLSVDQLNALSLSAQSSMCLYKNKAICLLSRWPFFDVFKDFLHFLLKIVLNEKGSNVSLERYISHFLFDVPFPTSEMPSIFMQLNEDHVICLKLPSESETPTGGEAFYTLVTSLLPDQIIQLFLYLLTEQKILLTSLRHSILTEIAEALIAMIFPLRWSVVYIPFLYLSRIHIIQSPSPYLIGVDTRFFDFFQLPEVIACADIDTGTVKSPQTDINIDVKMLPKKPYKLLKSTLDNLRKEAIKIPNVKQRADIDQFALARRKSQLGSRVKEAFLRFMATLLKDYQSYLIPVSENEDEELFDTESFLRTFDRNTKPLIQILCNTQLWQSFLTARSYHTFDNAYLAYFDRCIKTVLNDPSDSAPLMHSDKAIQSEYTKFIAPPEPQNESDEFSWANGFPEKLNFALFPNIDLSARFNLPSTSPMNSTDQLYPESGVDSRTNSRQNLTHSTAGATGSLGGSSDFSQLCDPDLLELRESRKLKNILRRSPQEIKDSDQKGEISKQDPFRWALYLLSSTYCLWYMILPAYLKSCGPGSDHPPWGDCDKEDDDDIVMWGTDCHREWAGDVLLKTIALLNRLSGTSELPDEVCYRVVVLLYSYYCPDEQNIHSLFDTKHFNAITYGLSNQILMEQEALNRDCPPLKLSSLRKAKDSLTQGDTQSLGSFHTPEDNIDVAQTVMHRARSFNEMHHNDSKMEPPDEELSSSGVTSESTRAGDEGESVCSEERNISGNDLTPKHSDCGQQDSVDELDHDIKQSTPVQNDGSVNCSHSNDEEFKSENNAIELSSKPNNQLFTVTNDEQTSGRLQSSLAALPPVASKTRVRKSTAKKIRPASTLINYAPLQRNGESKIVQGAPLLEELPDKNNLVYHDDVAGILMTAARKSDEPLKLTGETSHNLTEYQNVTEDNVSIITENNTALLTDSYLTENDDKIEISVSPQDPEPNHPSNDNSQTTPMIQCPPSPSVSMARVPVIDCDPLGALATSTPRPPPTQPPTNNEVLSTNNSYSLKVTPRGGRPSIGNPFSEERSEVHHSYLKKKSNEQLDEQTSPPISRQYRSVTNPSIAVAALAKFPSTSISSEDLGRKTSDGDNSSASSKGSISNTDGLNSALNNFKSLIKQTPRFVRQASVNYGRQSAASFRGLRTAAANTMQSLRSIANNTSTYLKTTYEDNADSGKPFSGSTGQILPGSMPWNQKQGARNDRLNVNSNIRRSVRASSASRANKSSHNQSGKIAPPKSLNSSFTDGYKRANPENTKDGDEIYYYLWYNITGTLLYPSNESISRNAAASKNRSHRNLIKVFMYSCCSCPACQECVYDEEIMQGWSPNDSNLNTLCPFCSKAFVPKLSVRIFWCPGSDDKRKSSDSGVSGESSTINLHQCVLHYLSPLVLRKELETVVFRENEEALRTTALIQEHQMLFWNLLWWCRRVGLPSHLSGVIVEWLKLTAPENIKECLDDNIGIEIHTKWDSSQIYGRVCQPLYQLWAQREKSRALIALNVPENSGLTCQNNQRIAIMEAIVSHVCQGDMYSAVKELITYRQTYPALLTKSIYREILFLMIKAVTASRLNHNLFDYAYYSAHHRLQDPKLVPLAGGGPVPHIPLFVIDKPPGAAAMWCRRLFQDLEL